MINRENYEIFFVDYLDGKLSPEAVDALMDFLRDNPDLQEELDAIGDMQLKPQNISFENKDKLKITPELPEINLANADDFLVKEIEEGLSGEEAEQLTALIGHHPEVGVSRDYFAKTKLKPGQEGFDRTSLLRLSSGITFEEACLMHMEGELDSGQESEFLRLLERYEYAAKSYALFSAAVLQPDQREVFASKSDLKKGGRVIPLWTRYATAAAAVIAAIVFWPAGAETDQAYNTRGGAAVSAFETEASEDLNFLVWEPTNATQEDVVDPQNRIRVAPSPNPQDDMAVLPERKDPIPAPEDIVLPIDDEQIVAINPFEVSDSIIAVPLDYIRPKDPEYLDVISITRPSQSITTRQLITQKIADKMGLEESPYTDDAGYLALNGVGKAFDKDVSYEKKEDAKHKRFGFSIGKVGFYRSKKVD